MAIAFVNSGSVTSSATTETSQAITYSPSAGNLVIVVAGWGSATSAPTCADNNSNALTGITCLAGRCTLFYGIAKSGATSYTVSWTTLAKATVLIAEYSGASGVIGATNTNSATSTTATVSVTTTGVNSWVVAAIFDGAASTYTASVGNLRVKLSGGAGNSNTVGINDNAGTAIGSVVVNTVTLGSAAWNTLGVEIRAALPVDEDVWVNPTPCVVDSPVLVWR